jgi:hypothetical protein
MKTVSARPMAALGARALAALAALVLAAAAAGARDTARVAIVDYGIYDHVVTGTAEAPEDISGRQIFVAKLSLREETTVIDAQKSRMFGYRFRVADPALVGQRLTMRMLVPKLTNPDTGRSTTVMERAFTAEADELRLFAYGFDHDWERAEGDWTFQVVYRGEVLAEKKFKVILPMN